MAIKLASLEGTSVTHVNLREIPKGACVGVQLKALGGEKVVIDLTTGRRNGTPTIERVIARKWAKEWKYDAERRCHTRQDCAYYGPVPILRSNFFDLNVGRKVNIDLTDFEIYTNPVVVEEIRVITPDSVAAPSDAS